MTWNPNAPNTLGLEYAPTRLDSATVGSEGAAYAVAFTAEQTRTLPAGGLGVVHQVVAGGDWTIELYTEASYDLAKADAEGINHATFDPTADLHVHPAAWSWPSDSLPYYRWVVGTPGTPENTNHLVHMSAAKAPWTGSFYAARYGGLAIPAGQRLLALRLLNDRQIANYSDTNTTPGQSGQAGLSSVETPFADLASGGQGRITAEERTAGLNQRQTVTYTFRPRHILTAANHAAATAQWALAGSGFGYFINSYSGPNLQMDSYHMQLTADYVPERRLAWGTGVRFGGSDASGLAQVAPLGERWSGWVAPGAAPTLTAGQRYVLVLRGPKYADRSPFVGRLPMLTPGPPISGYSSGRVAFDRNGLPAQSLPLTSSVGAPIYTGTPTSGPTFPPTSTPHADAMPWARQGVQPLVGAYPDGVSAWQRFTVPTGGVSVSQIVLPVARPDYDHASPLVVRILADVDPTYPPAGGAFFLTSDEWDALPGPYTLGGRTIKTVRASLPSPIALAAGNWWLNASTADAHPLTEATPWGVLYLEAETINAPPGPPNAFWPPAERLAPAEGGRQSSMVAVVAPARITGFTATRLPEQLVPATEACAGQWDTAVLAWDATALAADKFWRYELERMDVPEGSPDTWERIAHVADPATLTFTDREGRRGNTTRYRVRQMRTDGGTSAWVEAPSWAPAPYCCGVGLATNHAPGSLFYTDVEPLRKYTNLDASWLVLRPLYGGDYQQAFHPRERRGVRFETQLLVHSGAATKGLPTYDALRDLARAEVPAVAVLTEKGDRLYAALAVPELNTSPARGVQLYYATVQATEVTGTAPVVTIERPAADPTTTAGTFHLGPHANDKLDSNFFLGFG